MKYFIITITSIIAITALLVYDGLSSRDNDPLSTPTLVERDGPTCYKIEPWSEWWTISYRKPQEQSYKRVLRHHRLKHYGEHYGKDCQTLMITFDDSPDVKERAKNFILKEIEGRGGIDAYNWRVEKEQAECLKWLEGVKAAGKRADSIKAATEAAKSPEQKRDREPIEFCPAPDRRSGSALPVEAP